jgi:hypothetical protein
MTDKTEKHRKVAIIATLEELCQTYPLMIDGKSRWSSSPDRLEGQPYGMPA